MGHTVGRWSKVDAFMPHKALLRPQEFAYVKNELYVILTRGSQFQLVVMLYYYGTTNRSPNNFSLTSAAAVIF